VKCTSLYLLASSSNSTPIKLFTLSSGIKSPWYFDVRKVVFDPVGNQILGWLIDKLTNERADLIGGAANGGYALVSMSIRPLIGSPKRGGFVVRKSKKDHGLNSIVDGHYPESGDKVSLVEDVITTGESIMRAIGIVESVGAEVLDILTVVDRQEYCEGFKPYQSKVRSLFTKDYFAASMS